MQTRRLQRGATLLEAMIAMAVLMLGAAGAATLQRQSAFFMADAREATRAAAFAQDLVAQINLWDFNDPRLANTNTANDAAPADGFETDTPAITPDHGEADLTAGGTTWTGLSGSQAVLGSTLDVLGANHMERYWNVSSPDDYNGNGIPDALRITVIVRWKPAGSTAWRHTTFLVVKPSKVDYL